MNIEIHQPELEALIQQRMASGRFQSIEDVLMQALKSSPETAEPENGSGPKRSLAELFQPIRGLLTDEEVDTIFRRDPSPGRSVDLS
jgi:hypothetical protein